MEEQRVQRRLAAIPAAELVGSTAVPYARTKPDITDHGRCRTHDVL